MSKNIVMQQKTADGYEDLYPKADGDSSVIVNNTTNQFLGGGSTVGDALGYLSKFGMHWWKKVKSVPVYGVDSTATYGNKYSSWYVLGLVTPAYPSTNGTVVTRPFTCSKTVQVDGNGNISLGQTFDVYLEWITEYGDENRLVVEQSDNSCPCYMQYRSTLYYITTTASSQRLGISLGSDGNRNQALVMSSDYNKVYIPESYISSYTTTTTYICSSDPNAYPDQGNTDSSGAQYWKVGQPWEFLPKLGKVETGYYTGTGSGNVTLTFENAPQFVFISYKSTTDGGHASCAWCKDSSNGPYWVTGSSIQANTITQSGNNLTFTNMNKNAVAYQYFAITQ